MMTKRLRYLLSLFLMAGLLLPTSGSATPSDTSDTPDAEHLEKAEIMRLLNSRSFEDQERATQLISTYAHNNRYDESFFRLLVTPLHGIVATGQTDNLRIMAISALYSIGTTDAMDGLASQVDAIESKRVQKYSKYAIVTHQSDLTQDE